MNKRTHIHAYTAHEYTHHEYTRTHTYKAKASEKENDTTDVGVKKHWYKMSGKGRKKSAPGFQHGGVRQDWFPRWPREILINQGVSLRPPGLPHSPPLLLPASTPSEL